jgi:hypothetical protein
MAGRDPTVILNAVVAEEPDGYRGRRRRFLLSRKGGGVVLPALLVAASIVVVLVVVGVSQVLPRDANGQIPVAGNDNGAATGGNGPLQSNQSAPLSPGGSGEPNRSVPAKPSVSPSGGVSPAPGRPGAPAPVGSAPTTPPGRLAPFSIEAEKATLGGSARSLPCGTCSGGSKVGLLGANSGWVTVTVPGVPGAGTRQLTMTYELGEPFRTFYLSVNGGTGAPVTLTSNTIDWSTQLTATVPVTLAAGTNTIKFSNPTVSFAPDLDKVSVK